MSTGEDFRNPDPEEVNWQLSQGLKSCRSVIKNYRAMLSGDGQVLSPTSDDVFERATAAAPIVEEPSISSPE